MLTCPNSLETMSFARNSAGSSSPVAKLILPHCEGQSTYANVSRVSFDLSEDTPMYANVPKATFIDCSRLNSLPTLPLPVGPAKSLPLSSPVCKPALQRSNSVTRSVQTEPETPAEVLQRVQELLQREEPRKLHQCGGGLVDVRGGQDATISTPRLKIDLPVSPIADSSVLESPDPRTDDGDSIAGKISFSVTSENTNPQKSNVQGSIKFDISSSSKSRSQTLSPLVSISPCTPFSFHLPSPTSSASPTHIRLSCPWPARAPSPPVTQPIATTSLPANLKLSEGDLEAVSTTLDRLKLSGWYYGALSWRQAADLLRGTSVGTFLVRDSSDPRFLFSLSVQTERGPTSVRILYLDRKFKLDAEDHLATSMPLFDSVPDLVQHYVYVTAAAEGKHVWVDWCGKMYSHIRLTKPLIRSVPSLQHLCRLAVSRTGRTNLHLPKAVIEFLSKYPNKC